MESPVATVVSVHNSRAVVRAEAAAVCARCAAGRGCGAGLLGGTRSVGELEVTVAEGVRVRAGDRVCLSLEPANLLTASVFAYGFPLLGLMAALLLTWLVPVPVSDPQAVLAGALGLAIGAWAGRSASRGRACARRLEPVIHRLAEPAAASGR